MFQICNIEYDIRINLNDRNDIVLSKYLNYMNIQCYGIFQVCNLEYDTRITRNDKMIYFLYKYFVRTYASLFQQWDDERLRWSPRKHNDMSNLVLEANKLWRPEFAVING